MLESFWHEHYGKFVGDICGDVAQIGRIAQERTNNVVRVIPGFVDAVPVSRVQELVDASHRVYVATDQEFQSSCADVTVIKAPASFYGAYSFPQEISDHGIIDRDYNCFMNRIDCIRQSWFYLLYQHQLLDRGYVSFNLHHRRGLVYPSDNPKDTFECYHRLALSGFDNIWEGIRDIVPFRNFPESGILVDWILRSKFSLVIEVYHDRTDCQAFTEKTWRAIQLPRPWLLFAATGTVARLRNMGFDVFDDYVDHSYNTHDSSQECVTMQEEIIKQMKILAQVEITPGVLKDWQRRCVHNREIMRQWNSSLTQDRRQYLNEIERLVNHEVIRYQ